MFVFSLIMPRRGRTHKRIMSTGSKDRGKTGSVGKRQGEKRKKNKEEKGLVHEEKWKKGKSYAKDSV